MTTKTMIIVVLAIATVQLSLLVAAKEHNIQQLIKLKDAYAQEAANNANNLGACFQEGISRIAYLKCVCDSVGGKASFGAGADYNWDTNVADKHEMVKCEKKYQMRASDDFKAIN